MGQDYTAIYCLLGNPIGPTTTSTVRLWLQMPYNRRFPGLLVGSGVPRRVGRPHPTGALGLRVRCLFAGCPPKYLGSARPVFSTLLSNCHYNITMVRRKRENRPLETVPLSSIVSQLLPPLLWGVHDSSICCPCRCCCSKDYLDIDCWLNLFSILRGCLHTTG